MNTIFNKLLLVSKRSADTTRIHATVKQLTAALTAQGIDYHFAEQQPIADSILQNCELIVVLGGDGSILRSVPLAIAYNLPIVGVNLGRLGFLSDIATNHLEQLEQILHGHYHEESRFLLSTQLVTNAASTELFALNEILLLAEPLGSMLELQVYVNDEFLADYRADGLIIATPTGSTGHALSTGGPIVHPLLENLILTPVLPHNLNSRPIILANDSRIQIICKTNQAVKPVLKIDGQTEFTLQNTSIVVQKSSRRLRLLHPLTYNYFETLRTKLHWELP